MTISKRIPTVLVALAALALFAPATALARYTLNTHFESEFAAALAESNNKSFSALKGIAVDNSCALHDPVLTETSTPTTCHEFDPSNGDIYALDGGSPPHGVVDKFKVTGAGNTVKVQFECELGGTNMQVSSKPCSANKANEPFTTMNGIAVGPEGEVFVVSNVAPKQVYEFNAKGELTHEISGFSADMHTGTSAGSLTTPKLVTVEPSTGDLFVYDSGASDHPVYKLKKPTSATPELLQTLRGENFADIGAEWVITAMALDTNGNLYLADGVVGVGKVFRFKPDASPNEELDEFDASLWGPPHTAGSWYIAPTKLEGLAVDPTTNGLFNGEATKVTAYSYNAGELELVEGITGTTLSGTAEPANTVGGVAASSTGVVYSGQSSAPYVDAFEAGEPPTLGGCTISQVTPSGAKLEASVNPNGDETEYQFEYGTSTSYGTKTTKLSAGSGTSAVAESAMVTGLTPATKYDCRVYASSAGGEAHGANGEFTTKLAIEGVKTLPASSVAFESATINASLRPEGTPTVEYFIEYGTTTAYGHHTTAKTSSSSEVAVSEALSGLTPLTTYHYRIVAKREIESKTYSTDGSDVTFTTGGVPPGVIAESVSGIGAFSATLEATINPGNSATTYWFEYGTSPTSEQAFIPAGTVAGDGNIQAAPETLQNLAPDTTYYYHVVAENQFGRVEGIEGSKGPEERSFTTQPAYAPEVALSPVGEVAQTSAGLSLSVDPRGLATEYEVQLGQEGAYVPVVVQSAGEGEAPVQIGLALSALAPGSAYQVRVLAWNAAGEVTSTTQSFTTGASPAVTLTQPGTPVLVSFTPPSIVKPPVTTTTTSKTKSLTKAQKLAKALKACKRDKTKTKSAKCEKAARKKYAPVIPKKATKKRH